MRFAQGVKGEVMHCVQGVKGEVMHCVQGVKGGVMHCVQDNTTADSKCNVHFNFHERSELTS